MLPEEFANACPEDRNVSLGAQSTAVHDADRAMTVAAALDERLHARQRFRGCLTMQVETAARGVLAAFQPPQFTPVDTMRDIAGL